MSDVQALLSLQNHLRGLVRRLSQSGDTKGAAKARAALEAFEQLNQIETTE